MEHHDIVTLELRVTIELAERILVIVDDCDFHALSFVLERAIL
jgi:hypothetical protein